MLFGTVQQRTLVTLLAEFVVTIEKPALRNSKIGCVVHDPSTNTSPDRSSGSALSTSTPLQKNLYVGTFCRALQVIGRMGEESE